MEDKAALISVGRSILRFLDQEGSNGEFKNLTLTRLAKDSKLSASWVKKNIGPKNNDWIDFAAQLFGNWLNEIEVMSEPPTPKEWIEDRMKGISAFLDSALGLPAMIRLYFRFRGTKGRLGKNIAQLEEYYFNLSKKRLRCAFKLSDESLELMAKLNLMIDMGLAHEWIQNPADKEALLKQARGLITATTKSAA